MKKKLLFLSMYPAPYRVDFIRRFSSEYDVDIFFETFTGDERREEWFRQGNYHVLSTEEGARRYRESDLGSYDAALIFEYSTKEGVRLVLKCRRRRLPYFINCDGVILEKHGNPVRDLLKRYLIKGAAGYFAGGANAKEYFLRLGADEKKIFIHPFSELEDGDILKEPLTDEEKASFRCEKGLPADKKIAVAVGRFIPLKRYEHLIRAWRNMPDDVVLLLIGGGRMQQNYADVVREYDIKNVIIKDFVPKESLFGYYKASDVFVHPTSYDSWGLVVNEAMACGLPAVVSDRCVAGLELIRNGKNGWLVPMGDDDLMCRRVTEVLNGGDYRRMSLCALETIRPYTMSNMVKAQMNAIKETLGE